MKKIKLHLSTQSMSSVIDAIRQLDYEKPMLVSISDYKISRSADQNRLYWAWLTDMQDTGCNKHAGNTKAEWHYDMKEAYLVPIFIRDNPDYAEMFASLQAIYNFRMKDHYSKLRTHIINETSTTVATVEQFTEYLTDIQRYCDSAGIMLRTDEFLYSSAMGIK